MASQGFKSGNSTGLDNSNPQGSKQGKQNHSSSHKEHGSTDVQPPSTRDDNTRYKDIASDAQHVGDVASNAHDIKKAERALHEGLNQGRVEEGQTVSGAGGAPGGPKPSRKN